MRHTVKHRTGRKFGGKVNTLEIVMGEDLSYIVTIQIRLIGVNLVTSPKMDGER